MTQYIKAPFNFVPVSEKVFFPDWAKLISHDIPFSDGESGEIDLTITAHSPIFVRNGHTKKEAENNSDSYKSFSKINEEYFIPATSIKGAIRNVLEIMSFGKMRIDTQMKFATREWDDELMVNKNGESVRLYPLKKEQKTIHCGWLFKTKDEYKIKDCGKPDRINHIRIDEFLASKGISEKFENYFSEANGIDINEEFLYNKKKYDPKTAVLKYALISNNLKLLADLYFDKDTFYCKGYQKNRVKVSSAKSGNKGTIVFTGSPDTWDYPRQPKGGKFYEFVFPSSSVDGIPISENMFNYFKFIYSDSDDWKFWKDKVENGEEIPVFFRLDSSGTHVKDFGLAYLYKLPFDKSPYELLSDNHKPNYIKGPDLPECIFGYTSKSKSLKGRVQFGPAFIKGKAEKEPEVELVLGSPKASYYPIYVEQKGVNGTVTNYNVYSDGKNISGWKRYPVRKTTWGGKSEDNPDINSVFVPLKSESAFTSKIRFHNLKKEEIGALLSAITFHDNTGKYFHQLGLAKPYGYGKVSIEIGLDKTMKLTATEYMGLFEKAIVNDKELFDGKYVWHTTDQLSQLFTMAFDSETEKDNLLKYMHMDKDKEKNEFLKAKSLREYLERYTALSDERKNPVSLYKQKHEQEEKEKEDERILEEKRREEERLKEQQKQEEERRKQKEAKRLMIVSSGFKTTITDFSKRDAWEILSKDVERFICIFYSDNNYKRLLKNQTEGLLPEKEHEVLINVVLAIYNSKPDKQKKNWHKPFDSNPYLKKATEWIGKDKTISEIQTQII